MANIYAIPTENAMQTTLASNLAQGETGSMSLADDWETQLADVSANRPVIFVIDGKDTDGNATPSKREYIKAVSVSSTTISTLTRGQGGSTDQAHTAGAVVELITDVDTIKSITDGILVEHAYDGTHTDITADTVNIGSSVAVDETLDEDDMASDSATALATQQSIKAFVEGVPTNTDVTLDEDDMATDSASKLATQQSIKAYVDSFGNANCRVYNNTAQNIDSGATTKVQLDAENWDIGGHFDSTTNYRFTATEAGYYQVNAVAGIESLGAGKLMQLQIQNGGTTVAVAETYNRSTGAITTRTALSDCVELAVDGYVELFIYHNNGSALQVNDGFDKTFMTVHRLS